jgi:hypothetical protein
VKRFALWALLAVSLSANLAMAAVAARQRSWGASSEPRVFSKVALDPDQRARILQLRSHLVATRDEHARRIAELRARLAGAMTRRPEDTAGIDSILHGIAESQAGFQRAVVDHVLAVRAVLRPDQRPAFEEVVAGHMQAGGPMQCGFWPAPGEAVAR